MSFVNDIKARYINGNIVEKLIYVNIGLFLFTLLASVLSDLYNSNSSLIIDWLALDDSFSSTLLKPWSLVTYGFLHANFLHILFNLIALYFVGNLFVEYFTEKQLLYFYILGTVFGGLLFLISQNYFPLFEGKKTVLVGASAGISAIFVGIATYMPNYKFKIRFIGFVKLWHLAAFWIGLDILALSSNNAGGHFAHLGGALFGFLYVNKAANKDINLLDKILDYFKPKKKPLKTVYKSPKKQKSTVKNTSVNQQKIDKILDKIGKSGYDTLTKEEKDFLFKQGKN